VADNEGTVGRTLANVERFSSALGDNAPGVDRFLAQFGTRAGAHRRSRENGSNRSRPMSDPGAGSGPT
jgi:ABC-type transporter Mla subunit MlaD